MCKNLPEKYTVIDIYSVIDSKTGDRTEITYICADGELYNEDDQGLIEHLGECDECPYAESPE